MKDRIDLNNIPNHIAVIMDGNGRWAKQKGAIDRVFGHQNAVQAVREVTEACVEIGVKYLTLYAFSTENWNRPAHEVNALMNLLVSNIDKQIHLFTDNEVRLQVIGDFASLPKDVQAKLNAVMDKTKHFQRMTLVVALSYSGRWDMLQAANLLLEEARQGKLAGPVTEEVFAQYLSTRQIPDPELLIRTSGELRISNFLLWQLAYSELYFTDILWPDFRKQHLFEAVVNYQQRERRFGKTSDQIK